MYLRPVASHLSFLEIFSFLFITNKHFGLFICVVAAFDFLWRSHLQYLEHLRQVVGLRGYAQKDPLEEFRREAFKLFEGLLNKIKIDFITFLNNLEIINQEDVPIKNLNTLKKGLENNPKCLLVMKKNEKISRNERCPATGKKYKHCCGAL